MVRSATRLGRKGDEARPLLVLFRNPDDQAAVLDNAKKLNAADAWKGVRILQDLTRIQRQEEKLLRQEADELAAQLSDEEAKNWMFRVVGRRGARRVAKVPLSTVAERADVTRRPRLHPTRRASPARAARAAAPPPAATKPPLATTTPRAAETLPRPETTPRPVASPALPRPVVTPQRTPQPADTLETLVTHEDEEDQWTPVHGSGRRRRSARVMTRAQATTSDEALATVRLPQGQAPPVTRGKSNRGQAPPLTRGKNKRGQ